MPVSMRSSKPAGRQHQQQQPHRTTSSLSEQGLNSAAGNAKSRLPGKLPPSCCCRCDIFMQSWSHLWEFRLWSLLNDHALSIHARGTCLSYVQPLCCIPAAHNHRSVNLNLFTTAWSFLVHAFQLSKIAIGSVTATPATMLKQ